MAQNKDLKPITLYSHSKGPNPWKVAMILAELNIPYTSEYLNFPELKQEPYEKICINGRVPAIYDPNTDITLWESGAITEYLVETYDKENLLTYDTVPEKFLVKQWLYFQVSGQGPYFGQSIWFEKYHQEKLPSAQRRYKDQVLRVYDVLNRALEGKDYLVGDKCTYADISFMAWDYRYQAIFTDGEFASEELEKKYPNYVRWHKAIAARKAIKEVLEENDRIDAANSH
ncbi:hypothetical protein V494_04720 [Pseudogymnoascus sp. VKM F-4513 (FW-928)]|nr:hypothetical protein V494_04720 [Pseudogymnoascus sp. VKM F-4513 (FW-928)]